MKVLCKKSLKRVYHNFIKGNWYDYKTYNDEVVGILEIDGYGYGYDYYFTINKKNRYTFYYIWDYFYTEKEIRLLKLEEIDEGVM